MVFNGLGFFKRKSAVPERTPVTELVEKFVSEMETGVTDEWCLCVWRIHPDDRGAKAGHCVICDVPRTKHVAEHHAYRGMRRVRVDTHPHCPVHTKEGLILKYLKWVESRDAR